MRPQGKLGYSVTLSGGTVSGTAAAYFSLRRYKWPSVVSQSRNGPLLLSKMTARTVPVVDPPRERGAGAG